MSLFKALYKQEPTVPTIAVPLFNPLGPGTAKAGMCLIANEMFWLQSLASSSFMATTTNNSEFCESDILDLPLFALGDMVMFYHLRP